jgi:hypothetical protein
MSIIKLRSFKITLSFKEDIKQESINWMTKLMNKRFVYHYSVVEKGANGKEHYHAIVYSEDEIYGPDLKGQIWKALITIQNDGSKRRVAVQVNANVNQEWYDEYLRKEEDCRVITNVWVTDPNELFKYYPTGEQQKTLQEIGSKRKSYHVNADLYDGYEKFLDTCGLSSTFTNATAYFKIQCHKRYLTPSVKDLREKVKALHEWASCVIEPTQADLDWYNHQVTTTQKSTKRQKLDPIVYKYADEQWKNAVPEEEEVELQESSLHKEAEDLSSPAPDQFEPCYSEVVHATGGDQEEGI